MDNLKTRTLSHNVVNSISVMTFNVPKTDNDSHDLTVGQIMTMAVESELNVEAVRRYDRGGFEFTFIQLRSIYANDKGEAQE